MSIKTPGNLMDDILLHGQLPDIEGVCHYVARTGQFINNIEFRTQWGPNAAVSKDPNEITKIQWALGIAPGEYECGLNIRQTSRARFLSLSVTLSYSPTA
jgi:hypothetical protein